MNRLVGGFALIIVAASAATMAEEGFFVRAEVVATEPVYQMRRVSYPDRQCWNEKVRRHRPGGTQSFTPTIAGAIVGGVAGNQFSKGKRRDALTVAGALLGASIGHDLGHRGRGRSYLTTERRCETTQRYREQQHLLGYDVTYRYQGRLFTTRTDSDPGKYIEVRVQVEPVQDYAYNARTDWPDTAD